MRLSTQNAITEIKLVAVNPDKPAGFHETWVR